MSLFSGLIQNYLRNFSRSRRGHQFVDFASAEFMIIVIYSIFYKTRFYFNITIFHISCFTYLRHTDAISVSIIIIIGVIAVVICDIATDFPPNIK